MRDEATNVVEPLATGDRRLRNRSPERHGAIGPDGPHSTGAFTAAAELAVFDRRGLAARWE